jgi:hypothetical protein
MSQLEDVHFLTLLRSSLASFSHKHLGFLPMPSDSPGFSIGSGVREKFPLRNTAYGRGIVIKRYELGDEYRCVVRFENGREEVFFEKELIADPSELD